MITGTCPWYDNENSNTIVSTLYSFQNSTTYLFSLATVKRNVERLNRWSIYTGENQCSNNSLFKCQQSQFHSLSFPPTYYNTLPSYPCVCVSLIFLNRKGKWGKWGKWESMVDFGEFRHAEAYRRGRHEVGRALCLHLVKLIMTGMEHEDWWWWN